MIRIVGATVPEGWMTIIGVSRDVRTEALDEPARASYHFLRSQAPRFGDGPFRTMSIVARTTGSTDATLGTLRSAVRELDPRIALYNVQTAETILDPVKLASSGTASMYPPKYALLIQPDCLLLSIHSRCNSGCKARNIENGVMLRISARQTMRTAGREAPSTWTSPVNVVPRAASWQFGTVSE